MEIRDICMRELDTLWDETRRLVNPHLVYVDLSKILSNNPNYFSKKDTFVPNLEGYEKISQIIVEKIQNN